MKPLIRCGFGIGNRVAAIANALSRWPEIRFVWRNNKHCPLDHHEVFSNGIQGVEFDTEAEPAKASRFDGMHAETWDAALDRGAANTAYAVIIASMAGKPRYHPDVALAARFFCNQGADVSAIAKCAPPGTAPFVFADSRRAELKAALLERGCFPVWPDARELSSDLARTPEDTMAYLSDWKTLLSAKTIFSLSESRSALFPAMAAGKTVVNVHSFQ